MNNEETEAETASLADLAKEFGLALESSEAEPDTQDHDKPWHCLHYKVKLSRHGKTIWHDSYSLGVGHVNIETAKRPSHLSQDEEAMFYGWKRTAQASFKDKALQCQVAAKIANAQGIVPNLADVLHSLLSDGAAYFDAQTFEDWASDLGYDADSRKAEAIYRACNEIGRKFARAFSADELASLREAANNH